MINQPYSHSGEKCNKMSDEELTKAIYEAMQVPYLSERHDAIKKLITQYATQCYKEGERAGRIDELQHIEGDVYTTASVKQGRKLTSERLAELQSTKGEK